MSDQFSIGEIAIIACSIGSKGARFNGMEVQVVSAPYIYRGFLVVEVNADWLKAELPADMFLITPTSLRKRKPPPDWNAIAGIRVVKEPA